MGERIALQEYQQQLAQRLSQAAGQAAASTHVSLVSGSGLWLMDLHDAQEIIPLPAVTRVPLVRPWLRGVTNVRGNLIAVIDVADLRGEAPTETSSDARLVVLAPRFGVSAGLLVARSGGLVNVSELESEPAADLPRWAAAAYRDRAGQRHFTLAADALVRSNEFLTAALH